jgi:hypothetical protein
MQRISKLLNSIPEPVVRMRRLGRFFGEGDPVMIASVVEESALNSSTPAQKVVYLTLVHLLMTIRPRPPLPAGPLPLEDTSLLPDAPQIARIIGAARQIHAPFCATLLRELWRPHDKYDSRLLPPHLSIEHLPLGVRRERARSPHRAVFGPLLVETTPSVVQLLAHNTRLREPDMVALAALRPHHPYALWSVLLSHRWLSSDRVREACARNPVAKEWMILALSPLLGAAKLNELVCKVRLKEDVLTAMLPLYRGGCDRHLREALGRGEEPSRTVIFEIDETFDDAKAFADEQQSSG